MMPVIRFPSLHGRARGLPSREGKNHIHGFSPLQPPPLNETSPKYLSDTVMPTGQFPRVPVTMPTICQLDSFLNRPNKGPTLPMGRPQRPFIPQLRQCGNLPDSGLKIGKKSPMNPFLILKTPVTTDPNQINSLPVFEISPTIMPLIHEIPSGPLKRKPKKDPI